MQSIPMDSVIPIRYVVIFISDVSAYAATSLINVTTYLQF